MTDDTIEPDYSAESDYVSLKKHVVELLRRYFEYDDAGNRNKTYNPAFTAQDLVDDLHDYVGCI